jgi:hypothetical protein
LNFLPEQTVRRFLLGIATEEEECRVEDAILAGTLDESFLRDAEDQLIDDYLVGSLAGEESHGFTAHFLSAEERRQKLSFASSLIKYARKQPAEELSAGQKFGPRASIRAVLSWKQMALLAVAASFLLAALVGFDQIRLRHQTQLASEARNELTRLQAALAEGNSDSPQLGKPSTAALRSSEDGPNRMQVLELASSTRNVYPTLLHVPVQTQFVRIDLKLPLPLAAKYREVVLSQSGEQLWAQEFPASILSASKESAMVLPASILPPGLYHFQLENASSEGQFEESADWVFRVVKE